MQRCPSDGILVNLALHNTRQASGYSTGVTLSFISRCIKLCVVSLAVYLSNHCWVCSGLEQAQAACLAVCVGIPLTVSDVAPQQAGVIEAVVAVLSVGTTALEAKVRRGVSVSVCRYLWLYINHTSSNALDASSYAAPPSTFESSQVHLC